MQEEYKLSDRIKKFCFEYTENEKAWSANLPFLFALLLTYVLYYYQRTSTDGMQVMIIRNHRQYMQIKKFYSFCETCKRLDCDKNS